jgi:hypothetical protein
MRKLLTAFILVFVLSGLHAQLPGTFLVKPGRLAEVKNSYRKGNPEVNVLIGELLISADKELKLKPVSVMMKPKLPPSGNRHDYMSLAPYYWPDSTQPGYLPYVRRDGEHNPEIYTITDHKYLQELAEWVQDLTLAYYFTEDEKYAAKASQFLHTWFLDTATLMNPNLNYAQAMMGLNDGRGAGIIDARDFPSLLNVAGLLAGSKSWTMKDESELRAWFERYFTWLLESANGLSEHNVRNNHGTWYDLQVLSAAFYLGKTEWAREYLNTTLLRLSVQVEPDGRQPFELTRTNALHYSTFNIAAWFKLAALAENMGMDMWNYTTPDGRSLKTALDWLIPYGTGEKEWPYQQISDYKKEELYDLLLQAAIHYGGNYYVTAQKLKEDNGNGITEIFYDRLDN